MGVAHISIKKIVISKKENFKLLMLKIVEGFSNKIDSIFYSNLTNRFFKKDQLNKLPHSYP